VSADGDPYFYPDLNVLRNKAGIRDARQLQEFEHRMSATRQLALRDRPITGNFDLAHLKAIHQHLFQDVYDWAGKERTVILAKGGSLFALPERIESSGEQVFGAIARDNYLKGMDKERFTERLAHHYSDINALHAFREGNGRSTRVYLSQLAQEAGYELDYSKVSKERWNEAAKLSFDSDHKEMQQVFSAIATPTKAIAFDRDKPEDAVRKHPSLKSAFLTMKAAEIYAARVISDPASRDAFMTQTREKIHAILAEGKDMPEPRMKSRDQGLSR